MITGIVKSDEGRIRFRVTGTQGRQQVIDAVIDTGSNDSNVLTTNPKTATSD
jgi:hypothetical protein